ncbi:MerR family transcriptional regulator [Lachnospiraceae bacterium ZAX-1]
MGEVARATGLTVRTLQHYDNIGLMPPSGRTEGGRRYYTQSDMLRLSQIVFYKSVGIGLSDIRDKLPSKPTPSELETIFTEQLSVLLRKIDALHFAMSALNSSLDIIKSGNEPPIEILAELIRAMEGSSLADWTDFKFDPVLDESLEQSGLSTLGGALGFYHTMRELMLEAVTLRNSNATIDSDATLTLGKRWWEDIVLKVTVGGDEAAVTALTLNNNRENWPEADRKLFEQAEPFIEVTLEAYITTNNIAVPEAMMEGNQND